MDKGDFARSLNIAATIVSQDTQLIAEGTPDQIASAVTIVAKAVYEQTRDLADELGIDDDSGRDARPKPVRDNAPKGPSRYSNNNSEPSSSQGAPPTRMNPNDSRKSAGGLNTSGKQHNFFVKLLDQIAEEGKQPAYTWDDLENAGSYDDRQAMVDELTSQAPKRR